MNKVILQGRLTKDVEVQEYGKGKNAGMFAYFTLAVRDGLDENDKPKAQFINCVIFGKGAEVIEKFTEKGSALCVSGRLQVQVSEDKKGTNHYNTSVVVEDFDLISAVKEDEAEDDKKASKKYHR